MMLSDLVQYFTNKENMFPVYRETDLVRILRFFYKYTNIEEIKQGIEANVVFNPEIFFELNEVWFDDMYMNDMHLGDCLELNYENNFVEMVFSAFMSDMNFDIDFCNTDLCSLFRCEYGEDATMDQFMGFETTRKIENYINGFIKKEIESYISSEETLDYYFLEMERVILMRIYLENKSLARKIRKAYSKNSVVRDMFTDMNIFMMNGEFIALIMYNAESDVYGDYIDLEKIYTGIIEMRDILGVVNKNEIGHSLDNGFKTLDYELYREESDNMNNHYIFFNRIMKEHFAPKSEVIL